MMRPSWDGPGAARRVTAVVVLAAALAVASPARSSAQVATTTGGSPSTPDPGPEHAGMPEDGAQDQPEPRFLIQGFADVEWSAENAPVSSNSFSLGQLALFVNSRLSDQLSLLAEIVVEPDAGGTFVTDLERLHLTYSPSDHLRLRVGRFHTAIGYYNTAYHHGSYFETTAGRPALFAFEDEGGVVPVHELGLSASGRIPSGTLGLEYVAEVGNGQAWDAATGRLALATRDATPGKSTNVGFALAPDRVAGLRIGASSYRGTMSGPGGLPVGTRVQSAYAAYRTAAVLVLAESIWMRHQVRGAAAFLNHGFYVEASRRLGRVAPYARYEKLRPRAGTPLIGDVPATVGPTLGVRVDPSGMVAVKAQYERVADRQPSVIHRVRVQAAFSF